MFEKKSFCKILTLFSGRNMPTYQLKIMLNFYLSSAVIEDHVTSAAAHTVIPSKPDTLKL